MTQISEAVALDLIYRLLKNAADYEADAIVTLCPMCQLNLDGYQDSVNKRFGTNYQTPDSLLHATDGAGLWRAAADLGFGKEFVPADLALTKIGVEAAAARRRGRDSDRPRKRCPCRPPSCRSAVESDGDAMTEGTHRRLHLSLWLQHRRDGGCGGRGHAGRATRCEDRGVVVARDYQFMCSSLGQELIEADIKEQGLTRVVVGACSPHLHETTFRNACQRAGLEPLPVRDGLAPRASLLGAHRPPGRHREVEGHDLPAAWSGSRCTSRWSR